MFSKSLSVSNLVRVSLMACLVLCGQISILETASAGQERLAAGNHSLSIQADGILWAWGSNEYGQLGDGTTTDSFIPVQVLTGVVGVAVGYDHSLAIKDDGSLWAWGRNEYGQLGDGTTTDRLAPVQVLTGVIAVAGGAGHTLAIKDDGSLWAWGNNDYGQLGDGSTTHCLAPVQVMTGVTAVASGYWHSLAIKEDGSLWAWGNNDYGQLGDGSTTHYLAPVQVMTGVTAVSSAYDHTQGLKDDGSLWAWGNNDYGQLGDGTTIERINPIQVLTDVTSMSAGFNHSLAIKVDGSLWAWGKNEYGQLGDGTTADRLTPAQSLTGVTAMSAGYYHSLAIKADSSLWTWGNNSYGQLGCFDCGIFLSTPFHVKWYAINVSVSGSGTVTVRDPFGSIDCDNDCSEIYADGHAALTLTATPDTGFQFAGWGGICTGTGDCSLTIGAESNVTANFTAQTPTVTLDAASPAVVGAGPGDQTYVLDGAQLAANQRIALSDTQGDNVLQLADGLAIERSFIAPDALRLVLDNGAQVTLLGAATFGYTLGDGAQIPLSFADFAQEQLGVAVPPSGIATGGAATIAAP